MRKKRCKSCHELYVPLGHTYHEQKTCSKPGCRQWRRRQAVKQWKRMNPLSARNNPVKQKLWRQEHRDYWKQWRSKHPAYVNRNRQQQHRRNAHHRGLIAKGNTLSSVCIEKIRQIRSLRLIAKGNAWSEVLEYQIDGICRYLQMQVLIAKGNAIATNRHGMRQ